VTDHAPPGFRYPSTRYSGSKRRLLAWIWDRVKDLHFDSVLDVFGGTGSVSLMFKRYGKLVLYNDLLSFNQIIGTSLIENNGVLITEEDLDAVLECSRDAYPDFIQRGFRGIFFLDEENAWLDRTVANISTVEDLHKQSILMASLFQACLAKRPFSLFHRANLYMRTASVRRTFGNKTTWEHPFPELLRRYAAEYNGAVFSNGRRNRVIGGFGALSAPNGVDLVYLDPPYFSAGSSQGTNYLAFYHFLEGLADYANWPQRIQVGKGKIKRMGDSNEIHHFTKKSQIVDSMAKLLSRFKDSMIVLSYQDGGIPSRDQILSMLEDLGKKAKVFETPHRYVLSPEPKVELLFVAV